MSEFIVQSCEVLVVFVVGFVRSVEPLVDSLSSDVKEVCETCLCEGHCSDDPSDDFGVYAVAWHGRGSLLLCDVLCVLGATGGI